MGETLLSEDTYIKHSGIRDEVCEAENVIKKNNNKETRHDVNNVTV